ncbi:hypothetical protein GF325_00095 [Candidatus Bathyarchaeota archaeon]|nr:hypothetical protein [Candidatus Bathyarchaeota archaeon]
MSVDGVKKTRGSPRAGVSHAAPEFLLPVVILNLGALTGLAYWLPVDFLAALLDHEVMGSTR